MDFNLFWSFIHWNLILVCSCYLKKTFFWKNKNRCIVCWWCPHLFFRTNKRKLLFLSSFFIFFFIFFKKTFTASDDNIPIVLSDDGARIFITTKRLLKFVSNERPLYIDTSYKIIWQQPISVFGVSDNFDKSFKPVGLAITINEAVDDYEFIFMSIKERLDYEYKPRALISIASPAIRKAAENVFGKFSLIF